MQPQKKKKIKPPQSASQNERFDCGWLVIKNISRLFAQVALRC